MNNWWKYGLVFVGGAVAGALVYKNSKEIRAVCAKALGGVMDLKDKAMEAAEIVKESAEDLLAEADAQRKTAVKGA
jgi:stage V sporulation protein SpoVS